MSGGLIQLVAQGEQDVYLTKDPQITFFKIVYRRHTNFSNEMIIQRFNREPNFGDKVSATIARAGDMCGKIYIVVDLPAVTGLSGGIDRFRWVDYIGYSIINNVEIEIGGKLIDRHYGEWLYIWHELTGARFAGFDKMIGNKSSLTSITQTKDAYRLYIPLQFWFCRNTGLAIPLVNLQYSDVRINLELSEEKKCYIGSPTHSIAIENDVVGFVSGEMISQDTGSGLVTVGEFVYFDQIEKILYYNKKSANASGFMSISSNSVLSTAQRRVVLRSDANQIYKIIGNTTQFEVMPRINSSEKKYHYPKLRNFNIGDCYLMVDYFFLDEEEREKFALAKHEYLIEQVQFSGTKRIESVGTKVNINFENPMKEMIWVVQYAHASTVKDYYNFSDNAIETNGLSLIVSETININGHDRVTMRDAEYFDTIQPYQHHERSPKTGINMYSFCLYPTNHQPSGGINMSSVTRLSVQMTLRSSVGSNNPAVFRGYGTSYNILRVSDGVAGLVFSRD